jgi:hypothetical protein
MRKVEHMSYHTIHGGASVQAAAVPAAEEEPTKVGVGVGVGVGRKHHGVPFSQYHNFPYLNQTME